MLSNFRNLTLRRVLVMLLGIVLLSIGVALFDFSRMGNDPSTSVVIALGAQTREAARVRRPFLQRRG